MARAAYKLPNVFVGCPYSKPFNFQDFRSALDRSAAENRMAPIVPWLLP